MALVTQTIPNLMNGVSQQPDTIRLPNQCAEQINANCRVSDGLSKRQATELVSWSRLIDLSTSSPLGVLDSKLKGHTIINGNSVIQLFVEGTTGQLFIKKEGQPMAAIGAYPYLQGGSKENFKFITSGDTTYLLNKLKTVTTTGTDNARQMEQQGSFAYVRNGYFGTTYSVTINIRVGNTITGSAGPFNYTTNPSSATTDMTEIQTNMIANRNDGSLGLGKQLEDFIGNPANGWYNENLQISRAHNWFHVWIKTAAYSNHSVELVVTSSTAETAIIGVNGVTTDPLVLPRIGPANYVVKIDADPTQSGDQYYLRYDAAANGWVETKRLGLNKLINSSTLPLKITGILSGTIQVSNTVIEGRTVGDAETCPDPSFVGNTINDIFIFNNRLGFLSKNNVIMSKIDDFEVFYRTTVASSLASDRVDITAAIPSHRYTDLYAVVPFETALMITGDGAQYILTTNTGFDVSKTSLQTSTEYAYSRFCSPINLGSSVYFPVERGASSGIFDLSRKDGIGITAEEATQHVPHYIQGVISEMAYSSVENMLFVRTQSHKRIIYVQNRFIRNTVLEQNAWHKWMLPNDVVYMQVAGNYLYVNMLAEDGITMLTTRVNLNAARPEEDINSSEITFNPHLDLLKKLPMGSTVTVDDFEGDYFLQEGMETQLIGVDTSGAVIKGLDKINEYLEENTLWVGVPFTMRYTFSKILPAQYGDQGKQVMQYSNLLLGSMKLAYYTTGRFYAEVTPQGRPTNISEFTGSILGLTSSVLGKANLASGVFKFPINARSESVEIVIRSDSPYPCMFSTCEWQGRVLTKSGRM